MTPFNRLRLEKAAADCGFEMTAILHLGGLQMRSARFPETVFVRVIGEKTFEVSVSDPAILTPTADGQPIRIEDFGELYALLRTTAAHARTKPNRVADEFKKKTVTMPKSTEAERLIVQRVGQELFRTALFDYWGGRCCVTGLDVPELLRASHIRPWAECDTDEQRLDVFNGLLLAPHVDALFDGGWISFADFGGMVISPDLPPEACAQVGLSLTWRAVGLTESHRAYLAYHRANVMRH